MLTDFANPSGPKDPGMLFRRLGMQADPWQLQVLTTPAKRILLNCSRSAGKSTVAAAMALYEIVFKPFSMVVVLSRSERQAVELFKKVQLFYEAINSPNEKYQSQTELELTSHGRLVCLPCKEETIRCFSNVTLLIIDEAARVPDDIYKAVRPFLAVSDGRLICMSTPWGKRGFFYRAWAGVPPSGGAAGQPPKGGTPTDWLKIEIPASQVSRIKPEFLDEEMRELGPTWFRQEYCCSFEALEGLVYPDFGQCVVQVLPPELAGAKHLLEPGNRLKAGNIDYGQLVGGIDFGLRNPFAAVWGVLDKNDVLWITNEIYVRQQPLSKNAVLLPRSVTWYADPEGANERAELRCADFVVRQAINDLRAGIGAVTARIQTGRLKVLGPACPNLLAEADLYHYPNEALGETPGENPVKEYDHALDALRYLISRVDRRFMVRFRRGGKDPDRPGDGPPESPVGSPPPKPPPNPWLNYRNEELWTRII